MQFSKLFLCAVFALIALAPIARGAVPMQPSPHLVTVPDPVCDLVVTPANAATTLTQLNAPELRVFCIDPGDYRSFAIPLLTASGTSANPRYLRFNGPGAVKAFQRVPQAIFERIILSGSWWVVQGLSLRPQSASTSLILSLSGADHVVVDGNLIDAIEHPNGAVQNAINLQRISGPANATTDNTIQRNVIRNGDQSHLADDYTGILVSAGWLPGENNDDNRILDNEIADWGDGIALSGWTNDCSEAGVPRTTVIDGNDVYLTSAKYVDCITGDADPDGGCSCAENGIDLKADPGSSNPADWTRITRNRVWGYRSTTEAAVCGGSGALGQAIAAGNSCPGHVFVGRNLIGESNVGIDVGGHDWIVAGNFLHDIQPYDGHIYGTLALLLGTAATAIDIQWNTIVSSMNAYDDRSSDTDTRCNAVLLSPEWIYGGQPRGANHVTEYNYLYESGYSNLIGPTNAIYPTALSSADQTLCYKRKRWTGEETVCIPYGATTSMSPHLQSEPFCDKTIGAAFGMPILGYWANPSPVLGCGIGVELVAVLAAIGWVARSRASHSSAG